MERNDIIERRVSDHYAQHDLERRILDALAASGRDLDRLSTADLAPVDEFHTGGREATAEIAAQMGIGADMHLLDVGCGIGGATRFVAESYGCRVTGVDLTEQYVRTAEALTRLVGLESRASFRHASALAMPFAPGSFDGAYMLHVGMNVEDKPALFSEIRRVLKAGAVFAVYDVMRMGDGQVDFPLPCAATAETSFIERLPEYRRALDGAGFVVVTERDRLECARSFFRQAAEAGGGFGAPPPLGIHILLKDEAPRILANVVRLMDGDVLAPVELICRAR